jgi:hypothetical protein
MNDTAKTVDRHPTIVRSMHRTKWFVFHAWRDGAGMMPNVPDVAEDRDDMRATGGESRRRAQRTRPRPGKTGASIAQTDRLLSGRPTGSTEGYDEIACPDKDTRAHGRS